LGRRLSARLSRFVGYLKSENIFLEEALVDELLQIPSQAPTIDGLVPLPVVVGAVLFHSGK